LDVRHEAVLVLLDVLDGGGGFTGCCHVHSPAGAISAPDFMGWRGMPNEATSAIMSASVTSASAARTASLTRFHLPETGHTASMPHCSSEVSAQAVSAMGPS